MGGTDGTASMCTTEVLDMVENAWHPGPTMTFCRGNVSVAVVNEQLWYEAATVYLILLHTPSFLLEIRVIIKISKNPCYPINVD